MLLPILSGRDPQFDELSELQTRSRRSHRMRPTVIQYQVSALLALLMPTTASAN